MSHVHVDSQHSNNGAVNPVDVADDLDQEYIDQFQRYRRSNAPAPQSRGIIELDDAIADLHIYRVALEKDYNISTLLRQFEEVAVDCPLEYARNKFPDVYEGTEICYYQSCQYQCTSGTQLPDEPTLQHWLKNGAPELDESTFRSYFMADELERIENYLNVMFREMIADGEFYTTATALYYRLQDRFPELTHQIIGFPYYLMTLVAMTRRQHRLQTDAGQSYYLKFVGDLVYFTLNRDSTTVADVTTAMFRDLTVHVPTMERVIPMIERYHQSMIPRLIEWYTSAAIERKEDQFIHQLSAELKMGLYEHVYDKSDQTSRAIRRKFEQLLPDRFMTLPYLVKSMIDYQKIISKEVSRAGRPAASGQQGFTPNILETVNADTETVYVHMLNFVMSARYNIIANVINVHTAKFRVYRNGRWETPHAPGHSTAMDVVYQTYVALQRIEQQKDYMRRALELTGGIYGYNIRVGAETRYHIAEITPDEFRKIEQRPRANLTGASRDVKKGRRFDPGQYPLSNVKRVQDAYNFFAVRRGRPRNTKPLKEAVVDVPEMLEALGLNMSFSYDVH